MTDEEIKDLETGFHKIVQKLAKESGVPFLYHTDHCKAYRKKFKEICTGCASDFACQRFTELIANCFFPPDYERMKLLYTAPLDGKKLLF